MCVLGWPLQVAVIDVQGKGMANEILSASIETILVEQISLQGRIDVHPWMKCEHIRNTPLSKKHTP